MPRQLPVPAPMVAAIRPGQGGCGKIDLLGDPNGTRTRVFAVQGRRPRPLDDGAAQRSGVPVTGGSPAGQPHALIVAVAAPRQPTMPPLPAQAIAASSRCISAALPPFHSSRLMVPASHHRLSPGEESRAWPRSVVALRKAIHLKLFPSSPQASPRTCPSPTMPVLSSRAGPAATRGAGQPAPYGPAASRASQSSPATPRGARMASSISARPSSARSTSEASRLLMKSRKESSPPGASR